MVVIICVALILMVGWPLNFSGSLPIAASLARVNTICILWSVVWLVYENELDFFACAVPLFERLLIAKSLRNFAVGLVHSS